MYRIAVCEDESAILTANARLAEDALRELGIEGTVSAYSGGEALLAEFERDSRAFDLLLLDILMDGMNGMELAKTLRRRGMNAAIAFVTSSAEFLREGYQVQPVNYLFKPVRYGDVTEVIRTARRNGAAQTAVFRSGQTSVVLELSQLMWIEVYGHELHVHLTDGERVVSGSLASAMQVLPAGLFARCHNSYLVNLSYVAELSRTGVLLRGGVRLPVSRSYYEKIQTALINYLS